MVFTFPLHRKPIPTIQFYDNNAYICIHYSIELNNNYELTNIYLLEQMAINQPIPF